MDLKPALVFGPVPSPLSASGNRPSGTLVGELESERPDLHGIGGPPMFSTAVSVRIRVRFWVSEG